MKKILFLHLSLLCISLNAQQQYKRCLDGEMTRWSILDYHVTDIGLVSNDIIAYGDTIINDVLYKRMYFDDTFNPFEAEETNTVWKNYSPWLGREWGDFIRESEDASKLYIYDSREGEEFLISDMNLQEGDTFHVFIPAVKVDATVDSVYYKNGLKHILLHFVDNHLDGYYFSGRQTLTFIESVGPNYWFSYPFPFFAVNCFKNLTTFYKNDEM